MTIPTHRDVEPGKAQSREVETPLPPLLQSRRQSTWCEAGPSTSTLRPVSPQLPHTRSRHRSPPPASEGGPVRHARCYRHARYVTETRLRLGKPTRTVKTAPDTLKRCPAVTHTCLWAGCDRFRGTPDEIATHILWKHVPDGERTAAQSKKSAGSGIKCRWASSCTQEPMYTKNFHAHIAGSHLGTNDRHCMRCHRTMHKGTFRDQHGPATKCRQLRCSEKENCKWCMVQAPEEDMK